MGKKNRLKAILGFVVAGSCLLFFGNTVMAAAPVDGISAVKDKDRVELSAKKQSELFGEAGAPKTAQDADFNDTMNRLIYGEIYQTGNLTDQQRELVTLVVLATNQNMELFKDHVGAALKAGATPVEIKEAIYQCTPYIGFPKAMAALDQVNVVFKKKGISLPIKSQKQVTEETRFSKGLQVQKGIFGDMIDKMRANAPENQKQLQDYLSAYCFGDTYTRGGLDLKMRELLTFTAIASLGGCENQLRGHIKGNVSVGNTKETLISTITVCMPYIGFPRTLNALACVNEIIPEK